MRPTATLAFARPLWCAPHTVCFGSSLPAVQQRGLRLHERRHDLPARDRLLLDIWLVWLWH